MNTIFLNSNWTVKFQNQVFTTDIPKLDVEVLIDNGLLPDLNEAETDRIYAPISESNSIFSKTFNVTGETAKSERVLLHFDRLDTLCTVKLNGKKIGEGENIHRSYTFDIKEQLHEGENELEVIFHSLKKYIQKEQEKIKLPYNAMGTTGHPHIRKCACHFGWDFAPELCAQGISGSCKILWGNESEIDFFSVRHKTNGGNGIVDLHCEMGMGSKGTIRYQLFSPDGQCLASAEKSAEDNYCSFTVKNPQLWWCNGLGEQPLYTVTAVHLINDVVVSSREKKIGFRTIVLDKSKDDFGSNFQFIINGKAIFCKGGNYIPHNAVYTRTTKEKLRSLLTQCKEANMNMIRVWGGGFYESDEFYDLCDELGILVWQDCAFACCAYPFMKEDFLENVKEEIEENVRRLRHRASLALWCGNNEIESISMAWIARKDFIDSTGDFFYKTLPSLINEFDGVTPYHPCSPSSEKYMSLPNSDKSGDTHIWNVWHGYQYKEYFTKRFSRFCSEFGMQSYPDEKLIPHQKCDMGEERLRYYLTGIFTLAKSMKEKIYLTQLIQSEAMKQAVEHFRIHSDICHGALFWQLNDCWPSASWAGFDCEGNRKALIYSSKKFFAPLLITAEKEKGNVNVYLCNDTDKSFKGTVEISITDTLTGKEENMYVINEAASLSSKKIKTIKARKLKGKILKLKLIDMDENEVISENRLNFSKEKKLKLCDPKLSIKLDDFGHTVFATIKAENHARFVFVKIKGAELSDNFFDISKGEEKVIAITKKDGFNLKNSVEIFSLYDILKERDKIKDALLHLTEALRPMAMANRISRYFDK